MGCSGGISVGDCGGVPAEILKCLQVHEGQDLFSRVNTAVFELQLCWLMFSVFHSILPGHLDNPGCPCWVMGTWI